jgi:plasmid stabilization system protein ParE
MGFRPGPEAEAELDDIWLYVARESVSTEIANRLIDTITQHFWLLGRYPQIGRRRDGDLRPGLRSFPVGE